MTAISRFFTTTFTATRMSWANESSAEISAGTFKGHIQQATPEHAEHVGEVWAKTFLLWCAIDTDVDPGDSLTVASGSYEGTYSVKNVQINATGINQHLEVTIIKDVS